MKIMKRLLWALIFIASISLVIAQVKLDADVSDVSPGIEFPIKITIDDPSFFNLKTYDNVNLKVEIVGPAEFIDGEKTKTQNFGRIDKKTKIFEGTVKINKGHSEESGTVEIIAKVDYNLRNFQFLRWTWVVEESKTTADVVPESFEVNGFKVVGDIGGYESLLYENERLQKRISELEGQVRDKENDVSSKSGEIDQLKENLSLCDSEKTTLHDTISSLENQCKIKTIEPFIFIGLILVIIILAILLFKKRKRIHHHAHSNPHTKNHEDFIR